MRTGDGLLAAMKAFDARRDSWDSDWSPSPWVIAHAGVEWAVTTDKRVFLAVRRDLVPCDAAVAPTKVSGLAAKWLTRVSDVPMTVPAVLLKTFVGCATVTAACETCNNTRVVDCEDCDGHGSHECECHCGDLHDRNCTACRGKGGTKCPDCVGIESDGPAKLLSSVINRELLALLLETVAPDDESRVAVATLPITDKSKSKTFMFRPVDDDRWMALVMSMKDEVETPVVFEQPDTWRRPPSSRAERA